MLILSKQLVLPDIEKFDQLYMMCSNQHAMCNYLLCLLSTH